MTEPDPLVDLRERLLDIKQDVRALSLPLMTTMAQLGERITAIGTGLEEYRETNNKELREQAEDLRDLWRHVTELERQPISEAREASDRKTATRHILLAAAAGALASGVLAIALHAIGIG